MIINDDIYRIAYLTMSGLRICDVKARKDSKRGLVVEFMLTGENEEQEQEITQSYENETAKINVRQYLREIFKYRTLMYSVKNDWKTNGEQNHETKHRYSQS